MADDEHETATAVRAPVGPWHFRGGRRRLVVLALLAAGTVAAAVSAPHASPSSPPAGATTSLVAASRAVRVADETAEAARAVSTTRALFRRARGVVLAAAGDAAAVRSGASAAVRLGVPELVTGSGTDAEIRRLDARWVVLEGGVIPPHGLPQRSSASPATPSRQHSSAIVLTTDADADAAAVATARAAGATVTAMPEGVADPTVAASTVRTLAHAPDASVLLLGSAFQSLHDADWAVASARTGYELPGGGQRPFRDRRYVALYGVPGAPVLGALGDQDTAATITRAKTLASQYDDLSKVPVIPSLEIIATLASGSPGPDGDWSTELPASRLTPDIDAASKAGMSVILDLQPGRASLLTQAKSIAKLLERPNVGLALDPEWKLKPGQRPLHQIGSIDASEVNSVSAWLSGFVREHDLPPKMLVLHEFRTDMITHRSQLEQHEELDMAIHVDGQGSQPDKQATWRALHVDAPRGIAWGWKNFLHFDHPMLTPAQTMHDVHPAPTLITYQ